jgi:hypothetical protein
VLLYFAASISSWRLGRKIELNHQHHANEYLAWRFIAVLFVALGINKQLDLQTALTEAGRLAGHLQGWYQQRQSVQIAFIGLVAITCALMAIMLLDLDAQRPGPYMARPDRHDRGARLRFDPRCFIPSHRSLHRSEHPGFALELGYRSRRNKLSNFCKPMAGHKIRSTIERRCHVQKHIFKFSAAAAAATASKLVRTKFGEKNFRTAVIAKRSVTNSLLSAASAPHQVPLYIGLRIVVNFYFGRAGGTPSSIDLGISPFRHLSTSP